MPPYTSTIKLSIPFGMLLEGMGVLPISLMGPFQFLLGCYARVLSFCIPLPSQLSIPFGMLLSVSSGEKRAKWKLSIPFGMLPNIKRGNNIVTLLAFNSFWDATDAGAHRGGEPFPPLSIPFGMLRKTQIQTDRPYMAMLSIPFGMLRRRTKLNGWRTVLPFNSFWDATCGTYHSGRCPLHLYFQFLLGCYNWTPKYEQVVRVVAFNSFWDATRMGFALR